ncbi:hypothetical protein [Kitasatospora sp. NPDC004289]
MADDNVRLFPVMTPAGPPADPPDNPPAQVPQTPPATPLADPSEGASAPSDGGALEGLLPVPAARRSPLETIAALESPAPVVTIRPLPEPGAVPDTFRSQSHLAEHAQAPTPGLGTLSFAAALAVVVAAMRGVHGALTGRPGGRERADGDESGRRRPLQSAGEWGRRMLGPGRAPGGPGPGPRSGGAGGGPGPGSRSGGGAAGGRGGGGWSGGGSPGGPGPRRGPGTLGTLGADAPPRRRNSETPGPAGRDRRGGGGPDGPSPRNKERVKDRLGTGGGGGRGSGGGGGGGRSSGSGDSSAGGLVPRRSPHRTSQGGGPGAKQRKNKGTLGGANTTQAGATGTTGGTGSTGGSSGSGGKRRMSPKGTAGPKGTLRSQKNKGGSGGPTGSGGTGPGAAGGTSPKGKNGGTSPKGKGGGAVPPTGKKRGKAGGPNGLGGTTGVSIFTPGHKEKLGPGMRHGTLEAYQDCDCRCRRCMKAYQRYRTTPPGANTFKGAVRQEFERRWAKRMRNHQPVVSKLSKKQRRKAQKKKGKKTGPGGPAGPAASATSGGSRGPGSGPGPGGPGVRGWERLYRRARARFRARRAAHAGPGDSFWSTWRPSEEPRRTPWESAGMASAEGEVITGVERTDRPGDAARARRAKAAQVTTGARAVGPAPTPHTQRPGTTAPDRKEPSPMTSSSPAVPSGGGSLLAAAGVAGMSSEHATEVTLDDTLEVLEKLTEESFSAHEVCVRLAEEARRIREALEELAVDLRTRHNLIGRITAAAMERLAEAMDLVARKADEMKVSSLNAAELSEVAEQAMFDAYRPITQATADAGLAVPSARIHNEN